MKVTYLTLQGEKHPLCFSLSATEELISTFGDLDRMKAELFGNDLAKKIRASVTVLDILLRAGRRYAETMGEPLPPQIKGSVADLIDGSDKTAITAIFGTIEAGSEREVETKQKNA